MSCGNHRCSSIEASPRKSQSAEAGETFAAQTWPVHGSLVRLPIDRFRVIMRIGASISEMKNLSPPPQPRLNHRRHDAHISVIISSVFRIGPLHSTIVHSFEIGGDDCFGYNR